MEGGRQKKGSSKGAEAVKEGEGAAKEGAAKEGEQQRSRSGKGAGVANEQER